MLSEYFKLALKNLRKRRLRSWLTIIGISISVAIIFLLISLSLGLQDAVNEQFRQLGSDKFFIMPKGQAGAPGSGGAVELTIKDVEAIEKVHGIKAVSYITAGNAEVKFNDERRYFMVIGIPMDSLDVYEALVESSSLKIDEGRFLEKKDKYKVIIGSAYKSDNVFKKPVRVRDKLIINQQEFEVVGILQSIGNPHDDRNIMMAYDAFKELFNSGDRVDQIIVQIQQGENINDAAEETERKLRKFRGVTEKTQDFAILTPEELLKSFKSVLNIITAFLVGVAAISLLVGAVGIANTMYTSVLERTKEIGVMKAIGAKNSDIMYLFLIESGMLGLVGGIVGVAIGIAGAKIIEYIAINQLGTTLLKAATPFYLIIGSLAFAFIIGSLSGLFPAKQASQLKPVDALRYE